MPEDFNQQRPRSKSLRARNLSAQHGPAHVLSMVYRHLSHRVPRCVRCGSMGYSEEGCYCRTVCPIRSHTEWLCLGGGRKLSLVIRASRRNLRHQRPSFGRWPFSFGYCGAMFPVGADHGALHWTVSMDVPWRIAGLRYHWPHRRDLLRVGRGLGRSFTRLRSGA